MIGSVEITDFSLLMSVNDWVDLLAADRGVAVSGCYKGSGIQLKVGELVLTGVVSSYMLAFNRASWGLGDPTDEENAAFIEDFVVTYGGTARIIFHPVGDTGWTVFLVDGKYVTEDEFVAASV